MVRYLKYKIINSDTPENLAKEIDDYLLKGWELYGNPFSTESNHMLWFYQALVLK